MRGYLLPGAANQPGPLAQECLCLCVHLQRGGRVQETSVDFGWSQEEVARKVGATDDKTLRRWERGKVSPHPYSHQSSVSSRLILVAQNTSITSLQGEGILEARDRTTSLASPNTTIARFHERIDPVGNQPKCNNTQ